MVEDVEILIHAFTRVPPDRIAAFAGVPSGIAANLADRPAALGHHVRRLCGSGVAAGSALTARAGPGDNLAVFAALAQAQAGDILLLATDGNRDCAVIGDRVAAMAAGIGLAALVTDGLVRDLAGLREIGLPVHASGLSPLGPRQSGPASIGCSVDFGGVRIRSGDLVVADDDGVAIIAAGDMETALQRLPDALRIDEEGVRAARGGARYPARLASKLDQARHIPPGD
ncbi:RraA family protein [Sphingosinicella rhizophila]|uniref:Putative 4-hydroxy-4-methyl-2-oxoglutarate aldolase n=1 Tax=Sphingosinicella rhizophila TaxID=3050082 RepID=A0ABU3QC53_9SPHN|nr:RraA family protein [Sphingosinicella sp. GR2756]MDT9600969.1 RraA family protein [Sphingosinicella sp. GR2756]